jgi:hypothetical protein
MVGAMGPFEMLSGKQRELLACFESLDEVQGIEPLRERVSELLQELWLHVRLTERHLQPLVVRVEGHARALQEAEVLLTLHELMAELEWFPCGGLEWHARLMALEDTALAHIRSMELQLFPRLAEALDEQEKLDLVRSLAATREALWLEMRRGRHLNGGSVEALSDASGDIFF